MAEHTILNAARVDDAVFALRPDYRALLITVDGIAPGDSDADSDALLCQAEEHAQELLGHTAIEELPHIAAWREAYRAFGAKPQRTRNSLEALTRRAGAGLPRINRLTDLYNAICVLHQVPFGGEDLTAYVGSPHLIRSTGTEPFETITNGENVIEHPEPGEVVWCDDLGVTCRRWNWRQGPRTQITRDTTSALFILDALAPLSDQALTNAADDLLRHLRSSAPDLDVTTRLISAQEPS